jgi:serine/threonine-protein kinase
MGSVWLAERNDGRFERKVAVKFLNLALLGKTGAERFEREGIILGRLAHPHIAELIDAGVSGAGQPYLVLEYIDGDHIDRYCDQHGLDVPTRIRLFLRTIEPSARGLCRLCGFSLVSAICPFAVVPTSSFCPSTSIRVSVVPFLTEIACMTWI